MRRCEVLNATLLFVLFQTVLVYAVELNPSPEQITKAIEEGKKASSQRSHAPLNTFGNMGACGWGFLQTKLWSIWAASQLAERKFKQLSESEIHKNLSLDNMLITYTMCADSPKQKEGHIVLRQGQKIIQPSSIVSRLPEQSMHWPQSPAYIITVQAHFLYRDFDPLVPTTVIVVPPFGERIEYPIELSNFP
jgi:hypothetical protein